MPLPFASDVGHPGRLPWRCRGGAYPAGGSARFGHGVPSRHASRVKDLDKRNMKPRRCPSLRLLGGIPRDALSRAVHSVHIFCFRFQVVIPITKRVIKCCSTDRKSTYVFGVCVVKKCGNFERINAGMNLFVR